MCGALKMVSRHNRWVGPFYASAGISLSAHALYAIECTPKILQGMVGVTIATFIAMGKFVGQLLGLRWDVQRWDDNTGASHITKHDWAPCPVQVNWGKKKHIFEKGWPSEAMWLRTPPHHPRMRLRSELTNHIQADDEWESVSAHSCHLLMCLSLTQINLSFSSRFLFYWHLRRAV